MKKHLLVLFFFSLQISFFAWHSSAQSPEAIPFQGVARDNGGSLIPNQNISLRFSIQDSMAGGIVVYKETHSTTTNALGMFNVNIGQGSVVTGTFSSINWGKHAKFTQVEMDATGGSNYVNMGTSQMLSVPYALYAGSYPSVTSDPPIVVSNFTSGSIPFTQCPGLTRNITLSTLPTSVPTNLISVKIDITCLDVDGLDIFLIAPNGNILSLVSSLSSCGGSNYTNTVFNDNADETLLGDCIFPYTDIYKPSGLLYSVCSQTPTVSSFGAIGGGTINPNGTWSLLIFSKNFMLGTLNDWSISFLSSPPSGSWGLQGNAGTTISNFLGTTDEFPLRLKVNNQPSGIIAVNGNTSFGYKTLSSNTSGEDNTALGYQSLSSNTIGENNTAVGINSMTSNRRGYSNTAIGAFTLRGDTSGNYNTAVGCYALVGNQSGTNNTVIGSHCQQGDALVSGSYNTSVGSNSFSSLSGSYNTALGYKANLNALSLTNATAIGAMAKAYLSNTLVLGSVNGINGATSDVNVGIGTTIPYSKLTVGRTVTNSIYTTDTTNSAGIVVSGTDANARLQLGVGGTTLGPFAGWIQASYDNGGSNNGTKPLVLNPLGGSVGIGTTSPVPQLEVVGLNTPAATTGSTANGIARFQPTGTNATLDVGMTGSPAHAWIQSRDKASYAINYPLSLNPNGGNVGVGVASATSLLEVNGGFATKLTKSSGTGAVILDNSTAVFYLTSAVSATSFPTANTCPNRRYIIVNRSGATRSTTNYIQLSGLTGNTMANNTSIEIISDGTDWLQIK